MTEGAHPQSATGSPGSVLFLDVDGVLNRCGNLHDIEQDKVSLLRSIVMATGCSVVVSSTWRRSERTLGRLVKVLREGGVSLLDSTPCLDRVAADGSYVVTERGEEIQAWLDAHLGVTRFVILDDCTDMAHLGGHLVQTDSFTGLTEALAEEAIRRLK